MPRQVLNRKNIISLAFDDQEFSDEDSPTIEMVEALFAYMLSELKTALATPLPSNEGWSNQITMDTGYVDGEGTGLVGFRVYQVLEEDPELARLREEREAEERLARDIERHEKILCDLKKQVKK